MCTNEVRHHLSAKIVRNDLYLTAVINTQEQEIQRLQAINYELKTKFFKSNVGFHLLLIIIHYIT